MSQYDEQLKLLQQKIANAKRMTYILPKLYEKRNELSQKVYHLENCKLSEQEDVDRLESLNPTSVFYRIIGIIDEKLTKEKEEARVASVNYEVASRELEAIRDAIWRAECDARDIEYYEQKYREVLQAKIDAIKALDIPEAKELSSLEEKITAKENMQKEVNEAIAAGKNALRIAQDMKESLDSAKKWGTYDLLGGGLIADVAKHEHLNTAQTQVENLRVALRKLKTELTDITVQAPMDVSMDGFVKFSDYFFDGLFADWTVMDKIKQSQSQINKTIDDILRVNSTLYYMEKDIMQELDRLLDMRNHIIEEISL